MADDNRIHLGDDDLPPYTDDKCPPAYHDSAETTSLPPLDSRAHSTSHSSQPVPPTRSVLPIRPARQKRHSTRSCLRRYWWLILAALTAVVVAVVVVVVVVVILPRQYASHQQVVVDQGNISFTSLYVPNNDPNDDFHVYINALWTTNSSDSYQLEPWTAQVSWIDHWRGGSLNANAPLTLQLPQLSSANGTSFNVEMKISQSNFTSSFTSSEFSQLVGDAVVAHPITLVLTENGTVTGQGDSVKYGKTVNLIPDIRQIPDLAQLYPTITFNSLTQTSGTTSANVNASMVLYNTKNVTVDLGAVTASLKSTNDSKAICQATFPNVRLQPGNQTIPLSMTCDLWAIDYWPNYLKYTSQSKGCGSWSASLFNLSSRTTQGTPTWFDSGLGRLEVSTWVNVAPAYKSAGLTERLNDGCAGIMIDRPMLARAEGPTSRNDALMV